MTSIAPSFSSVSLVPNKEDSISVHRKKKDTTPNTPCSTQEQPAPPLPDQQAFHQHLRELARGGIRVVLEGVMREELDTLIGQTSPRPPSHISFLSIGLKSCWVAKQASQWKTFLKRSDLTTEATLIDRVSELLLSRGQCV